jgi:opacity protein-like surface antigen
MLEGFRPGTNYTWGAGMQRNLSNTIQISLNYEGRKPPGLKTVHTGSMQARAFF